jgi:hypothetical protein
MMTLEEYERMRQQMEADKKAGFSDMQDDQPPAEADKQQHPVKEVDYDKNRLEEQQSIINS